MAGNRIAGITIEIGGDTTKLQSALKGVDKQLSTTQKNLKDTDKLLKLDPGNITLLTQKQKNLNTAINTTKTRLETLKQAQTDNLTTEEYDALQREIIETEQQLANLEQQYKDFGSVGAQKAKVVGAKMKAVGDKMVNVGTKLSTYVTAPIVGLGVAAYAAFNAVDAGEDVIITKTGATGEALQGMSDIMKNLAKTIPTDFETAGEAVGEVNTRFGLQGQALEDLSAKYIKFAKINGTDVTSAVDSTQKALAAFGLDADDAGNLLDRLTKVSQDTGISVATLTSGLVQNSAAFTEMGLSIDDAATFMGQMELSGADSSAVMTGLSKALKNATKEGIPLDQALQDLQKSILEGKDGTDGLTYAYELFGTKGAQIYEAVKNGTLDFTNLGGAAEDAGGKVETTFDATLDPADKFTTALNTLKVLGNDLAVIVMPFLTKAVEKVKDMIEKATAIWNGLTDAQKETILKILGVAAAIGPLLIVGGKVTKGVGNILELAPKLVGAFQGVVTFLSGPGGIVAAIAAAVAAGIWLYKNWDKVKETAEKVWAAVVKYVTEAWDKIKNIDWAALGASMWNAIKASFKKAGEWLKNVFDQAKTAISQIDWIALGKAIWSGIKTAFNLVLSYYTTLFTSVWNLIKAIDWKALGSAVWSAISSAFLTARTWFTTAFTSVWNGIKAIDWKSVGSHIWTSIKDNFHAIGSWFYDKFDSAKTMILSLPWASVGTSIWSAIKNKFGDVKKWFTDKFKAAVNAVIGLLNTMIGKAETAINKVVKGINSKLTVNVDFGNLPKFLGGGSLGGIHWSPNIPEAKFSRIKTLAQGGNVLEGGRAIVGEHQPEFLRVVNGRAIVTPMTSKPARYGGGDTITINVHAAKGQSAREIAQEVQRIFVMQQKQRGAAYA